MRAAILVLLILGIAASAPSAWAGLSASPRQSAVEPASLTDEATQQSEDQIGMTRAKRRDVQRRLTRLGFDTKATGRFDDATRDAISRWQEQHGYPKTGFLNTAQNQALRSESAAVREASRSEHHGSRGRRSRGIGGPIGAIGHMVGGIIGR